MEGGLSGRPTECRYCRYLSPKRLVTLSTSRHYTNNCIYLSKGRCHGNHFLAFYIWGAHWCYLANTTEPSVCGGNAAYVKLLRPLVAVVAGIS